MPTLARLAELKICMYAGDHNPPHFHVIGRPGSGIAFRVRLDTLQVLNGTATRSAYAQAVAWASENSKLLSRKWAEFNERD